MKLGQTVTSTDLHHIAFLSQIIRAGLFFSALGVMLVHTIFSHHTFMHHAKFPVQHALFFLKNSINKTNTYVHTFVNMQSFMRSAKKQSLL